MKMRDLVVFGLIVCVGGVSLVSGFGCAAAPPNPQDDPGFESFARLLPDSDEINPSNSSDTNPPELECAHLITEVPGDGIIVWAFFDEQLSFIGSPDSTETIRRARYMGEEDSLTPGRETRLQFLEVDLSPKGPNLEDQLDGGEDYFTDSGALGNSPNSPKWVRERVITEQTVIIDRVVIELSGLFLIYQVIDSRFDVSYTTRLRDTHAITVNILETFTAESNRDGATCANTEPPR